MGGCIAMRGLPRLRRDSGSPLMAVAPCRAKAGIAPGGRVAWVWLRPKQLPPKEVNLAGGCPAELAVLLLRSAQTAAGNQKDAHTVRNAGAHTGGAALFHCHMLHHAAGLLRRPAAAALRNRSAWHVGRRSLRALAQAVRTARAAQSMKVSIGPIF